MKRNRMSTARAFLLGYIQSLTLCGRSEVPTVRELAAQSGTSRSAMQRAVDRLAAQGRLVVRHGSGIRIAADRTVSSACTPTTRRRTEDVCRELERRVLSGALRRDEMIPPRKELMAQLGVSYRSLRAALERLSEEGLLIPEKRSYRVRPARNSPRQTLYLFAGAYASRPPPPANTHTIERECAKANLKLVTVRHHWLGTRMIFDRNIDFSPDELASTIGFLVWTMGYNEAVFPQLMGILHRFRKPIGLLDERHALHRRPIPYANRLMRCVPIMGREDEGAALGRYFRDRGHRRLLYVSPNDSTVPDTRHRGLSAVFGRATDSGGVFCIYTSGEPPLIGGERVLSFMLAGGRRTAASGHLQTAMRDACEAQSTAIAREVNARLFREHVGPAIERDVDEHGITAIVGYNDWTALAVLQHLRERGVSVPGHVSVAGFDDSPQASAAGLTSYNFNSEEAIALLVGHIIEGAGSGRSARVDLVQGYVTERGSSGNCRAMIDD
ncbi:MAG: GntR family transcriptional regulator [Chitinivibrionales bacterium]|nr:GntR family transcriptional regulator [Chitinivibrionales bacterium]